MSGFLGSYRHQIDEKGRVSLPAAFRRDAGEQRFVLVQAYPGALTMYPEKTWEGVEERLREVLRLQPRSRAAVLSVTANAVEVVPDRQGRILVPQRMLQSVGIGDSALLVGVIDRVEIWDPERFDSVISEGSAEFGDFASQVFG